MDYQLIRFKIDDLNDFVRAGLLGLPDFQRDFVWGPPRVVDLMQSIAREWPIGSILLLEGAADFECKALEHAPKLNSEKVKYLLLDGQQRVTSIYHAVQDISDYVYYVNMDIIVTEGLDEDFIFYMGRKNFEAMYPSIQSRASKGILKICELYETELFFEWLQNIDGVDKKKELSKVRRNYVYGLNSGVYSIPATVLPNEISFDALSKIFEGLNTNSVKLTTSDLLVAKNLPKKVNLREMWASYEESDPSVGALNLELLDVLKICALNERIAGNPSIRGIKQNDLVKIDALIYQRRWSEACHQLSVAILFAIKNLGVISSKLVPNSYSLVALSFALKQGWPSDRLIEWWISRILGETFAQSGHTRMMNEVKSIIDYPSKTANSSSDFERMQAELNAAMAKPFATNAYLARGILSLRLAFSSLVKIDPYIDGDSVRIVGENGQTPTKTAAIESLNVTLTKKMKAAENLIDADDNDFRNVKLLVKKLSEKKS